jgi:probable rRNA maturation factor
MDNESTHSISVTIAAGPWHAAVTEAEGRCRKAASAVLAKLDGQSRRLELGILLTDDAAIRVLNRTWRGKDASTNVLSFGVDGDPAMLPPGAPWLLGDVVVALETVRREAERDGKSCADHLTHLIVHGVLHLLGYDHETDLDARRMEALETEILSGLGIADPYRELAA